MAEPARILVVDDDLASRSLMEQVLAEDGHAVTPCADGAEAVRKLEEEAARGAEFDAVVSDIRMVDVDGLEVLDYVQKHAPETPVLLVTAFGNVDGAVDAIRRGAYDYISKPYDVNAIKLVVDRALRHRRLAAENRRLKREIREKYALQNVVGRSEGMLQVYKTAARVALTDATVLVMGESGTGKELVARAIHSASARSAGPFIAVDCGAIAEGVLESELFGHARG
jgi:DNA-binding NtrC family response regulator